MLPASHLTLAYPYGETEKLRPGEAGGLCWVHMVAAALSVKSRPERFVLICCSGACVCACPHVCSCVHARVRTHTHTHKQNPLSSNMAKRCVCL